MNDYIIMNKRCLLCNKKLKLASTFICKCDGVFCTYHRYPEVHTCTFDHKTFERNILIKNNPVVVGDKLEKI